MGDEVRGAQVNLLALETATDLVGAALWRDGAVAERSHLGGRAHGELLAPLIEGVCALSGCTLPEVDALAVDVGPGLFTGLRVGVATAKAFGQALGVGIVGATSLDILAAGALESAGPERAARVVAVVDARRREVFAAAYAFAGGPPREDGTVDPADVCDDRSEALTPDELVAWLGDLAATGPVLVVGDGAVRYLDLLTPLAGVDVGLAGELTSPAPATLARLAARRLAAGTVATGAGDLAPDYRRHADARINWEERSPQRTAAPPDRP